MTRLLNEIAAEVDPLLWYIERNTKATWVRCARPYVGAMFSLQNIGDSYGLDSGEWIVRRFLKNIVPWKGPVARRIKRELLDALEVADVYA